MSDTAAAPAPSPSPVPDTYAWAREIVAAAGPGLAGRMGIEFVEVDPQRTVATMPVAGNTQAYGLLHGGASAALAETLGSVAAALHAGPDRVAVGIELNATHHRSAREGLVTGVATPLHLGGRTATYEIVVTDEAQRRLCTARLTCVLLEATPTPTPSGSSS